MCTKNRKGTIIKLWGIRSPKLYDGDFLKLQKEELENLFSGTMVVADGHFEWGRKTNNMKGVQFLVPYSKKRGRKRKREEKDSDDEDGGLNNQQQNYNRLVQSIRAHIESSFGLLKSRFQALQKPWGEDEKQLQYLVVFASVIENKIKN